jgi:hypothetical protein
MIKQLRKSYKLEKMEADRFINRVSRPLVSAERTLANGVKEAYGWLAFRIKDAMEPQRYD